MRKPTSAYAKTKTQTAQLISAIVFATKIVRSPLLSKFEVSSLYAASALVHPILCRTRSDTPKTGFIVVWLISDV